MIADMPARADSNLPALGLIVLRVDETIEHEFREFIPTSSARLHVTRIDSGDDLTPASIARMGSRLTDAAALLPPAANFDVVAYACTSGTAHLGAENVANLVRRGVTTRHVTNPLTAAVAQIRSLGLTRIGLVSPYVPSVATPLIDAFSAAGVEVTSSLSLSEDDEAKVARISPQTIADAAKQVAGRADMDGIFLSCTNLNTAGILRPLSDALGLPILSSNHALAWHMQSLLK